MSSSNQIMPIFVINLKQDVHKKQHMQSMADKLGLNFTYIDAVYGKDLDQSTVDSICLHDASMKVIKRKLFRGEVGVALSQMSIYQIMVDKDIKEAVVFEDDVLINESLVEVISSTHNFPKDWEIVLLGYHRHFISNKFDRLSLRNRKKVSQHFKIVRFTDVMDGAFGYIINLKGAKQMLKVLKKGLIEPVDCYTGNSKYINLYGIYPKCVKVDISIGSSINEERFAHFIQEGNEEKPLTAKDKLKAKLNKYGVLSFLQKINSKRGIWQSELKHLSKRLKLPTEYK